MVYMLSATSSKPHALYLTGSSHATKTSVHCRGPLKAVNPLGLLGGGVSIPSKVPLKAQLDWDLGSLDARSKPWLSGSIP